MKVNLVKFHDDKYGIRKKGLFYEAYYKFSSQTFWSTSLLYNLDKCKTSDYEEALKVYKDIVQEPEVVF